MFNWGQSRRERIQADRTDMLRRLRAQLQQSRLAYIANPFGSNASSSAASISASTATSSYSHGVYAGGAGGSGGGAVAGGSGYFLFPLELQLSVKLGGIGISVVDGTPTELLYLAASGIRLELLHVMPDHHEATLLSENIGGSDAGRDNLMPPGRMAMHLGIQISGLQVRQSSVPTCTCTPPLPHTHTDIILTLNPPHPNPGFGLHTG